MNINRHNYESWFILYMDNELDPVQREAVEVFVQKNPDLKDELDLLFQFKLTPDTTIVYEGKENLMLPAAARLENAELQEWLVLYMDNELDEVRKQQLEAMITTDSSVKEEWEWMQRTRLEPETIVFPDKQSLYRSEEKIRRITPGFWRVAAAIFLLLLTGSVAVIMINNKKSSGGNGEIVNTNSQNNTDKKQDAPVTVPVDKNATTDQQLIANGDNIDDKPIQQNTTNVSANTDKKNETIKKGTPGITPMPERKEEPIIASNTQKDNDLPQPDPERKVNDAIVIDNATISPEIKSVPQVTNPDLPTSEYKTAMDDNIRDDGSSDGGGKRSSLRGFFRKVTRNVEKRTGVDPADSDNRLLVGGLSIKLK